jgi:hypothetical protein
MSVNPFLVLSTMSDVRGDLLQFRGIIDIANPQRSVVLRNPTRETLAKVVRRPANLIGKWAVRCRGP